MQAVILAAGAAERLRPLTHRRPKGMLLVAGRPILEHLARTAVAAGAQRIVLVVGPNAEKIQAFFGDGHDLGVPVLYAHQSEPTGTADALRHAAPLLEKDQPTLVLPGDNFLTSEGLNQGLNGSDTLFLSTPRRSERYGLPRLKGELIQSLEDSQSPDATARVSTGVLVATPRLIQALSDDELRQHQDLDTFLDAWIHQGNQLTAHDLQGVWEDVTSPWDLLRLNEHVLERMQPAAEATEHPYVTGNVVIGNDCNIAPTARLVGPVTIGDGCTIGDHSVVGPFVSIRHNTIIGTHCEVRRSILNNNVHLDSYGLLRGSILDDGVHIGPRFGCLEEAADQGLVGCVIGHDAVIGPDQRVQSGTLIEPETRITGHGP